MSHRCLIGRLDSDTREIKYVYCHDKGCPEDMGHMLTTYWNAPERVEALMQFGAISWVGREVGKKHSFDKHWQYTPFPEHKLKPNSPGGKHWCCFYLRDRCWESDTDEAYGIQTCAGKAEYITAYKDEWDAETIYLYQPDAFGNWEWYVFWLGPYQYIDYDPQYGTKRVDIDAPESFTRCTEIMQFMADELEKRGVFDQAA